MTLYRPYVHHIIRESNVNTNPHDDLQKLIWYKFQTEKEIHKSFIVPYHVILSFFPDGSVSLLDKFVTCKQLGSYFIVCTNLLAPVKHIT